MHRTNILLAALIALACATSLHADKPAWVIPDVLNVREKPGLDSAKAGTVSRGDQVIVTAFRDDHWCKALLPGGGTGWVKEDHLTFSADKGRQIAKDQGKSPMAVPAWVEPPVTNLRKGPSVDTEVVQQLSRGDKVYATEVNGSWRKVKTSSGKYGWIRSDLLEFDLAAGRKLAGGSTPARTTSPPPAWIKGNVVNARKGPSVGYSQVGQLTKGTKVYITARKGEWAQCKNPQIEGWIHADLLETNIAEGRELAGDSGGGRDKAYCIGDNVYLRSGPDTGSEDLDKLKQGTTLWVLEEKNDWCKVQVEGGRAGWMAGWYVRRHGAQQPLSRPPGPEPLSPPGDDFPSPNADSDEGKLQPFTAWIGEDSTNVRSGPGLDKSVEFQLPKHQRVKVTDCSGQWCQVTTESGSSGWTAGWVLDFQPPGAPEASKIINGRRQEIKAGWVNRATVNVRAGQGTDTQIVGTASLGDELVIVDREGNWLKVLMGDGTVGWIADSLIETRAERLAAGEPGTGGDSSLGAKARAEAMRHLGKPYVRGAEGPYAFDCSGFTQYVYSKFGVKLSRTTDGQYRQGCPVGRDDLQPGDVLVFKNTYKSGISHVGIYIGDGNFIHASNSRGGVKISAIDSSYYAPKYVGARRME